MEMLENNLTDIKDAEIYWYPDFLSKKKADMYLETLLQTVEWKQEQMHFGPKTINIPRLTAWYGDKGKNYTYSGITVKPLPWTPILEEIMEMVEDETGITFNSVLLNYYRDGRDSVAWHSDDEPELGENPIIASVSFGASRDFQLRHIKNKKLKDTIRLHHGSMIVMAGTTQTYWQHQIPKVLSAIPVGERINLTFRTIK